MSIPTKPRFSSEDNLDTEFCRRCETNCTAGYEPEKLSKWACLPGKSRSLKSSRWALVQILVPSEFRLSALQRLQMSPGLHYYPLVSHNPNIWYALTLIFMITHGRHALSCLISRACLAVSGLNRPCRRPDLRFCLTSLIASWGLSSVDNIWCQFNGSGSRYSFSVVSELTATAFSS